MWRTFQRTFWICLIGFTAVLIRDHLVATKIEATRQENKAVVRRVLDSLRPPVRQLSKSEVIEGSIYTSIRNQIVASHLQGFVICKGVQEICPETSPCVLYEGDLMGDYVMILFRDGFLTQWSKEYWSQHPSRKDAEIVRLGQ